LSIDINQDVSHGRKITRKVSVYRVNNILHQGWKHLKVVIQIERSGWRGSKPYTEKVYYVSSAMNEAEIFARRIRGHWGIENQYHWVKDVIFQEDKRRISQFQAATNFSILITIVINLFRSWGFLSIKEGQRWLADHWYKIFLLPDLSASKSLR
jgi:predicted transposase YbfD/YdcC